MLNRCVLRRRAGIALIVAGLVGCAGESADDLFTKGEEATHDVETYDESIKHLTAFIENFPDDPRADIALQAMARVYQAQSKSDLAIATYNQLIERFPDSRYADQAQFMVGYIYDLNGNRDSAIEAYKKVIASYPQSGLADDARVSIENIDKPLESWIGEAQKSSN